MTKITLSLVTLFLLLTLSIACPHSTFIKRHVCTYCQNTQKEAEAYAAIAAANRPNPTGKSSIFITTKMTYTYDKASNLCIFDERAPKYECYPRAGTNYKQWDCNYKKEVIARHSSLNGHYFYQDDTF